MSIIIADRMCNMIAIKVPGDFMYWEEFKILAHIWGLSGRIR